MAVNFKPSISGPEAASFIASAILFMLALGGLAAQGISATFTILTFALAGLVILPPAVRRARAVAPALRPTWVPPLLSVVILAGLGSAARLDVRLMPQRHRPDSPAATTADASPTYDPAMLKAFVLSQAKRQARDPSSVSLRNVVAYHSRGGHLTFCGEINGKNGFGGYTGMSPFVLTDSGFYAGADATVELRSQVCNGSHTELKF